MVTDSTTPNASAATTPHGAVSVTVRIKRQDGPGAVARWEEFRVEAEPNWNVISVLRAIAARPVTTAGQSTTPPAWENGCLEEVCGACTMVINGKARQSCSALVQDLCPQGGTLTLEPMSKFPLVRDLVVDRERMFHNLRRIKGWVPIDGTWHLGHGPRETPEQQQTRYRLSECMTCGCCLEACPQFGLEDRPEAWDSAFVGAQVISQARYFNMHATGAVLKDDRLDVLMGEGGVSDCGNAQNCVKACPNHIPLAESIAEIGRQATIRGVKRFFGS